MKNLLFVLGIGLTIFSCNAKPDKNDAELRAQTMVSCEKEALQANMSDEKKILVKEYCSCATDKMLGEFTYTEMLQLNSPSKELQDRLMKLIDPCVRELKTKSAEIGE